MVSVFRGVPPIWGLFLASCWRLAGVLLVSCWPLTGLLLASCWLLAGLLLASCWPLAGFLLASCWPLLASCWPLAGFLLKFPHEDFCRGLPDYFWPPDSRASQTIFGQGFPDHFCHFWSGNLRASQTIFNHFKASRTISSHLSISSRAQQQRAEAPSARMISGSVYSGAADPCARKISAFVCS